MQTVKAKNQKYLDKYNTNVNNKPDKLLMLGKQTAGKFFLRHIYAFTSLSTQVTSSVFVVDAVEEEGLLF